MKKYMIDFLILLFIYVVTISSLFCNTEFIRSSFSDTGEDLFINNSHQTILLENRERDWNYHT